MCCIVSWRGGTACVRIYEKCHSGYFKTFQNNSHTIHPSWAAIHSIKCLIKVSIVALQLVSFASALLNYRHYNYLQYDWGQKMDLGIHFVITCRSLVTHVLVCTTTAHTFDVKKKVENKMSNIDKGKNNWENQYKVDRSRWQIQINPTY